MVNRPECPQLMVTLTISRAYGTSKIKERPHHGFAERHTVTEALREYGHNYEPVELDDLADLKPDDWEGAVKVRLHDRARIPPSNIVPAPLQVHYVQHLQRRVLPQRRRHWLRTLSTEEGPGLLRPCPRRPPLEAACQGHVRAPEMDGPQRCVIISESDIPFLTPS